MQDGVAEGPRRARATESPSPQLGPPGSPPTVHPLPPPRPLPPRPLPSPPRPRSTKLEITATVSTIWYFGVMAATSFVYFLLTGAIGFISTLAFVNRIYAAIKVD